MISLPGSECWHFKISWTHCQVQFQFSLRDFEASKILLSWRDLTWSLTKILGEFLAAKIKRSHGDLDENLNEFDFRILPRSQQESRRVVGCRDFEILEVAHRF